MDDTLNELDMIFDEIGGNEGAEAMANSGYNDWEDGQYECEVDSAEWTESKDGVPMVKVVFGVAGYDNKIYDYLMFGHKEKDRKKISAAVSRSITKLKQLGLVADSVTGYVSQLPKLEGAKLTLRLETTKSGFQQKHYENVRA